MRLEYCALVALLFFFFAIFSQPKELLCDFVSAFVFIRSDIWCCFAYFGHNLYYRRLRRSSSSRNFRPAAELWPSWWGKLFPSAEILFMQGALAEAPIWHTNWAGEEIKTYCR